MLRRDAHAGPWEVLAELPESASKTTVSLAMNYMPIPGPNPIAVAYVGTHDAGDGSIAHIYRGNTYHCKRSIFLITMPTFGENRS